MVKRLEKQKAKILLKKGLSQKDIAKKLGVTEKTVSVWVRGFKSNRNNLENQVIALKEQLAVLSITIKDLQTQINNLQE